MGVCFVTKRPFTTYTWEAQCFPDRRKINSTSIERDHNFDLSESESVNHAEVCLINKRISLAFLEGRNSSNFKMQCFTLFHELLYHSIRSHACVDPESISVSHATKIISNDEIRGSLQVHVIPPKRESLQIRKKYGVYLCASFQEYHSHRDNLIAPYEVHLQRPDPSWKIKAENIKRMLMGMHCSKQWKLLEHIGSTAIPDLIAKPIIDLMIVLKKEEDFTDCFEHFLKGQADLEKLPFKIAFTSKAPCSNDDWGFFQVPHNAAKECRICEINIHIFVEGTRNAIEKLLFRDFLTSSKGGLLKAEYAKLKKNLMEKLQNNKLSVPQYTRSKSDIVARILSAAEKWSKDRGENTESSSEFIRISERYTRFKTSPDVHLRSPERTCPKAGTYHEMRLRITRSLKDAKSSKTTDRDNSDFDSKPALARFPSAELLRFEDISTQDSSETYDIYD